MLKGLVSIIVPIYKVDEFYLKKCIECIQNQSYKNIEILLIDDGSPDDSGKICDQFAEKDERIRVEHIKNQGVSNARNVGLTIAKGEFVSFVDSDDFINQYMIEHLVDVIENTYADCAMCSCNTVEEQSVVYEELCIKNDEIHICELNRQESMDTLVYMGKPYPNVEITAVWGTLYRHAKIKEILFNVNMSIGEDFAFKYNVFKNVSKIVISDAQYYTYILHEQSAMRSGFQRKKIESIKALQEMVIREEYEEYREGLICRAVNIAFVILFMIPIKKKYVSDRKLIIEFIKKYRIAVLKNHKARKKVKLAVACSYIGFNNAQRVFQIFQE